MEPFFFNGKKIENLYIEGDDLMSGRYGAATKVIRKEMIESVDIINHFQPISVLKNKVFTDNVALNLILKDENSLKVSTSATLAVGLPAQTEVSMAPLLLSKNLKTINQIAYNNAGIDYKNDFKQLGSVNFTEQNNLSLKDVLLSFAGVPTPDIPLIYYYFNSAALLNLNAIIKNKSEMQFKINANVFADNNAQNYRGETISYLANDTIRYIEQEYVRSKPQSANAALSMLLNKPGYYFNNLLKVMAGRENVTGASAFNNTRFNQQLQQTLTEFSNELTYIPSLSNKAIAEVKYFIHYRANQQLLQLDTGYYFDILPQQGFYEKVQQNLKSPLLHHEGYLSYKIPGSPILQDYKIGYQYTNQQLLGNLYLLSNGFGTPYANDRGNDLNFKTTRPYFTAYYQLKLKKLRVDLTLPFTLQKIRLNQIFYQLKETKNNLFFLPKLNFTYNFDNEKYVQGSIALQNVFSDITNAYYGAILLNYRSVQAYTQGLQKTTSINTDLRYYYQKSIKLLFINIGFNYNASNASAILADSFSNNIRRTFLVSMPNKIGNIAINGGVSKYLFRAKAKINLKVQVQFINSQQLINRQQVAIRIGNYSAGVATDKKIGGLIALTHKANFNWFRNTISNKANMVYYPQISSFYFDQSFKISFKVVKNVYVETNGTHRINKQSAISNAGYFFIDGAVKIPGIIKGMDVEFNCFNLLNVKDYISITQSGNQLSGSSYPLRGATFFLRANYSF